MLGDANPWNHHPSLCTPQQPQENPSSAGKMRPQMKTSL